MSYNDKELDESRLLDTSSESNTLIDSPFGDLLVTTINETNAKATTQRQQASNESPLATRQHDDSARTSKFVVVKLKENEAARVNSTSSSAHLIDKNEPESLIDINNNTGGSENAATASNHNNNNNNELLALDVSFKTEDDVFDEEQLNFNDLPFESHRENEGQDTITSLTNNVYKRQLDKIRRKSQLKRNSIASSNSSINSTTCQPNQRKSESTSGKSSGDDSRTIDFKSLFQSQESIKSKKSAVGSLAFFSFSNPNASNANIRASIDREPDLNLTTTTTTNAKRKPSVKHRYSTVRSASTTQTILDSKDTSSINVTSKANNSDQVFEVLQEVINNNDATNLEKQMFIEKVIRTVTLQKLNHQNKKNTARGACLCAELTIIALILVMAFFFVKTVHDTMQIIHNKTMYAAAGDAANDTIFDSVYNFTNLPNLQFSNDSLQTV